jgi:pilus assembly protein Flp/PilA
MKKVINYFNKLKTKGLLKYLENEDGLVAIEYALIGVLIAVAIITVAGTLGQQIVAVFQRIVDALAAA